MIGCGIKGSLIGRTKWAKNGPKMGQKLEKTQIIEKYFKLALGLPMKVCKRIYGDLSWGVGTRGRSWG